MAQSILTNLDLSKNQLLNPLAHVLGADPGTPSAGQFWYRSDLGALSFENASTVIRLGRLDQISAPTASVSMNSQLITNLLAPSSPTDATNKSYVDGLVGGGIAWKNPVRAATAAAGTLATSFANGQVIDGITLATGDRILIKDQAAGQENGIYTVNAAGAPTRGTDSDTAAKLNGAAVFVNIGTANADSAFTMTTDAVTLGTTPLVWVRFTGLGTVTAGAGLTKTGDTLDVVGTAARITVAADSIDIAATYVGQTSITTLGTVATGVWNGTIIAPLYAGTGIASPTAASVLITQGASAMTVATGSAANTVLRRGAAGDPSFGAIDLTTGQVTGTLPVTLGGTGVVSPTANGVLIGAGASAMTVVTGAQYTVLRAGASGVPTFGSINLDQAVAVTGTLPIGNGGGYTTAATAKTALGFPTKFSVGCSAATSTTVTHNLGTRDVTVLVYRTTTPWDVVITDVEMTTTNTVTVRFAVAPAASDYTIVVIG